MLINDESCNSEKTILRYQKNGIVDLLGSDWYGIILLSPSGKIHLDTYNDIHRIGNEIPLRFVEECVDWEELARKKCQSFEYEGMYFLTYSIRQTDRKDYVFFLHCRLNSPFDERDVRWYELYSTVGQQRVLLENELIQEKNYLSSILESTDGCIAVVDSDYRIISSNDNAKAVFGDSLKTSSSGEMLSLMKAVDKVLLQQEKVILPRTIFNGVDNGYGFSIYKFVLTPLRSSKGKVGCVVVVATDITKEFIDKRRATQKQQFQLVKNMTYEMSKDIRTALMNIQGCATLLMDSVGTTEESEELLTFIKKEANQIQQISGQISSAGKVAGIDGGYGLVDVNEVIQNCISALYREFKKRKVTVETELGEDIPLMSMKDIDLQQIFFNLLLSSVKSSKSKGTLRINSYFERQKDIVVVKLLNDGDNDDFKEQQRYLQINGGKMQNWIDIPFLLAKKIVLDCGGKLETKELEDNHSVRIVTLPYSDYVALRDYKENRGDFNEANTGC